jgi:hypothetical protein
MTEYVLTQGDTRPIINATLTAQGTTTPINLHECSVKFQMRRADDKLYTVNGACSIVNESAGTVSYSLGTNDLNTPGEYVAQFEITYPDNRVQTTSSLIPIKVRRQ